LEWDRGEVRILSIVSFAERFPFDTLGRIALRERVATARRFLLFSMRFAVLGDRRSCALTSPCQICRRRSGAGVQRIVGGRALKALGRPAASVGRAWLPWRFVIDLVRFALPQMIRGGGWEGPRLGLSGDSELEPAFAFFPAGPPTSNSLVGAESRKDDNRR